MRSPFFLPASRNAVGALCAVGATLLLSACGAAEDAATESLDAVHHSASLSGTWHGSDGSSGPANATFEQRGLSVTATLNLEQHRCVDRVVVVGVVDTDGVSGTADVGAMHIRFSGKPDLSDLIADYESAADGPCPGDRGNVQLLR